MDQVFEIEALRKRALDELRRRQQWMGTGEVALALGVPTWAVTPALESARAAGLAEEFNGQWRAAEAAAAPAESDPDQRGMYFGGAPA